MRSILLSIILITSILLSINAQNNLQYSNHENYHRLNDSTLVSIKKLISNDLANKQIFVIEGNWNWLGFAYKLSLIQKWNNRTIFLIMS